MARRDGEAAGGADTARPYSPAGLFGRGLLMGTADVVPGVSGGTIALILGIYTPFIDALASLNLRWAKHLLRAAALGGGERRQALALANLHLRTIHWRFLLPLLGGILLAIGAGSRLIPWLLERYRAETLAAFFGLILASVPLPARMVPRWRAAEVLAAGAALAGAFALTGLPALQLTHALWMVFLSGAVGICAMVLPGISGSFMLVVLGQYAYVLECVRELRLVPLAAFGCGVLGGLISFARVLRWLLHRRPGPTLAALTGFMVGALRAVWPFKIAAPTADGAAVLRNTWPTAFDALVVRVLVCFVLAFAAVALLEALGRRRAGATPAGAPH
ncbi:MAG: hypothetical protein KatS3mg102_1515 [Planctomycetota bacterium]|nr:MAG: hypothetical protein KatS3mg102_1515 [Planctomycetota bacterium]